MEIEREFEIVVEEYNAVNESLTSIQHDMATTQLIVRRIEQRMGTKEEAAVALAIELYKAGPTGAAVEAVLSSETLADIENRLEYLKSSNEAQSKVFEKLAVDRVELDAHLAALEDQKSEALAAEARLAELRTDVEAKVAGQRDEIAELNAAIERAAAQEAAAEAAARRAAARAAPSSAVADIGPIKPAPAPNKGAQAAVDAALSQLGKPYQWGASGPDTYDCSGLTSWAWAHADVALPHNSGMQYNATPRVAENDWQPGDLLFFGDPIHHVAMYIGNGQMVEAPYTGSQVRVNDAYRSDYVGAGRPGV
jgi:cell wall-associated NlpC family hydrolase